MPSSRPGIRPFFASSAVAVKTIEDHARAIVTSTDLEVKLAPLPPGLPLRDPGGAGEEVLLGPGRPPELEIVSVRTYQTPSLLGWGDPAQRRRILHALANHEFQAVELFAWAVVAFPDAPEAFRRGLLAVLADEQRHTRMYLARLEAHGGRFGDHPVTGHFWHKARHLTTPARFVCAMSLTFENANLDHTLDYAAVARQHGDRPTEAVIERVHRDEIEHVAFGWRWLGRFKRPEQSMWEAYVENLCPPLHPGRASGREFRPEGRRAAGLDEDFLARLAAAREATDSAGRRL